MNIDLRLLFPLVFLLLISCSDTNDDIMENMNEMENMDDMDNMDDTDEMDNMDDTDDELAMGANGTVLYQDEKLGYLRVDLNSDGQSDFYMQNFYVVNGIWSVQRFVIELEENAYLNLQPYIDTSYIYLDTIITNSEDSPYVYVHAHRTDSCERLNEENESLEIMESRKLIYKEPLDSIPSPDSLWFSGGNLSISFKVSQASENYGTSGDTIRQRVFHYVRGCLSPPLDTEVYFHIKLVMDDRDYLARVTFERTSDSDLFIHEILLYD